MLRIAAAMHHHLVCTRCAFTLSVRSALNFLCPVKASIAWLVAEQLWH